MQASTETQKHKGFIKEMDEFLQDLQKWKHQREQDAPDTSATPEESKAR